MTRCGSRVCAGRGASGRVTVDILAIGLLITCSINRRTLRFKSALSASTRDGHFDHLGTFDEVRIFKLLPESPFYATEDKAYIAGKSLWGDINHAVKLACARDWRDYTDLLEAMAAGMLAGRDAAFARKQWEDALQQVAIGIYQKGGPLAVEVAAGVENVRLSRGASRGPKLVLSSDVAQAKNVVYER